MKVDALSDIFNLYEKAAPKKKWSLLLTLITLLAAASGRVNGSEFDFPKESIINEHNNFNSPKDEFNYPDKDPYEERGLTLGGVKLKFEHLDEMNSAFFMHNRNKINMIQYPANNPIQDRCFVYEIDMTNDLLEPIGSYQKLKDKEDENFIQSFEKSAMKYVNGNDSSSSPNYFLDMVNMAYLKDKGRSTKKGANRGGSPGSSVLEPIPPWDSTLLIPTPVGGSRVGPSSLGSTKGSPRGSPMSLPVGSSMGPSMGPAVTMPMPADGSPIAGPSMQEPTPIQTPLASVEVKATEKTAEPTTDRMNVDAAENVTEETAKKVPDETASNATDETASNATDETASNATDETASNATDETAPNATDETALNATDETAPNATDETASNATDETASNATDETAPNATDETPLNATDETPLNATDETTQRTSDKVVENVESAAAENAEAPAAENAEASVAENAEASVAENAEASVAENAEAPVAENAEAPVDENAETAPTEAIPSTTEAVNAESQKEEGSNTQDAAGQSAKNTEAQTPIDAEKGPITGASGVQPNPYLSRRDILNNAFERYSQYYDEMKAFNDSFLFAAVMDGHSGEVIADIVKRWLGFYVKKQLMEKLRNNDNQVLTPSDIVASLEEAHIQLENDILKKAKEYFFQGNAKYTRVGSCSLSVLIDKNYYYVSNVGDSRGLLIKKDSVVRLNNIHNATEINERMRLIQEHPNEMDVVMCKRTVRTGNVKFFETFGLTEHDTQLQLSDFDRCFVKGRLQCTRTFGDFHLKHKIFAFNYKKNKFIVKEPHSFPYISAIPEVLKIRRTEDDEFIVLVSDGISDDLGDKKIYDIVKQYSYSVKKLSQIIIKSVLTKACMKARLTPRGMLTWVDRDSRRKFFDDMSVVVIKLK
ncbi:hypothetical protein C922_02346 [Plasmodium inui San Antonio 1]|uniref:PPM-type phosphatase domain-containing protein n=1 Tax=Plasmodium inui San Antonio 1 TaxID=1237626 RepID=W7AP83_9APIC|nr:hypothetical protein C922_02346 [Plasmodium inui San Antonio 1]EUD67196.1 hypothetical protein C922_02346 [Plasmodium inui San Antonio 1]